MARNLDILVGLVVQGWERGALNAEEVVRTLQRVELAPNVACGVQSAETFDAGPNVPPAATVDAPVPDGMSSRTVTAGQAFTAEDLYKDLVARNSEVAAGSVERLKPAKPE